MSQLNRKQPLNTEAKGEKEQPQIIFQSSAGDKPDLSNKPVSRRWERLENFNVGSQEWVSDES